MKFFNRRLVAAFTVAFVAWMPVQAEELRIGTASQGGAFYPVGQAISTLVNKYADGLTMVPVVTGGSVQNPKLVNSKEVDIAITNNNLAVLANKGAAMYKKGGKMNLRAVGSLHFSVLHMLTLKNSSINTIADLKGKRVAIGPAGGGTTPFTKQVLGLHGMTLEDITPSFLSYNDGFAQLADGNVDAAFALSGYPSGAVQQARVSKELKFIKLADMPAALAKYKNYNEVVIDKGIYKTPEDGHVLGVKNMLITDASADPDKIYAITKATYANLEEFKKINAYAKQIDPAESLTLKIPLHPGAERYHKQ